MRTFIVTTSFIGILALFAIADAFVLAPSLPIFASTTTEPTIQTEVTPKIESIDVKAAAEKHGFTVHDNSERLLLSSIDTATVVQTYSLVYANDRVGSIAFTTSPSVKNEYQTLKEVLHRNFSSQVQDLRDETLREAGEPVRNQLTFYDPGISNDRLVFMRIRDRLYEIRIQPGKEEVLQVLIDDLSR
jgi:hypothetical protein